MSGRKCIAVVGCNGQVGRMLMRVLPERGFEVVGLARPGIDLGRPLSVRTTLATARPDVVVNAAGYTAVDKAEDEPADAFAINRDGAGAVAAAAAARSAPVIHFSTDYVFDGAKGRAYVEDDATAPLGVYGASKLAGEIAVRAANPAHVIVRTSWVCGPDGSNFVKTMMRLAAQRPEISVVADQRGAPTFTSAIAEAVAAIATRLLAYPADADLRGTFHLGSARETTWFAFAEAIQAGLKARGHTAVPVKPITTAEYPTRARRPAYSMLDSGKLQRVHGIAPADWRRDLEACLDVLAGGSAHAQHSNKGAA